MTMSRLLSFILPFAMIISIVLSLNDYAYPGPSLHHLKSKQSEVKEIDKLGANIYAELQTGPSQEPSNFKLINFYNLTPDSMETSDSLVSYEIDYPGSSPKTVTYERLNKYTTSLEDDDKRSVPLRTYNRQSFSRHYGSPRILTLNPTQSNTIYSGKIDPIKSLTTTTFDISKYIQPPMNSPIKNLFTPNVNEYKVKNTNTGLSFFRESHTTNDLPAVTDNNLPIHPAFQTDLDVSKLHIQTYPDGLSFKPNFKLQDVPNLYPPYGGYGAAVATKGQIEQFFEDQKKHEHSDTSTISPETVTRGQYYQFLKGQNDERLEQDEEVNNFKGFEIRRPSYRLGDDFLKRERSEKRPVMTLGLRHYGSRVA